jgi:hypothetical protein
VQELAGHNRQLQQKQETTTVHTQCDSRMTGLNRNSAGVSTTLYNRQKAELSQFRKRRDAEKVKQKNTELMAEPDAKRELDGLRRELANHVDTLLSTNGEAQATEAQFDGADGEAAPSADYQELEDLSLEELATAEPLIEGLQELRFEAKKQEQRKAEMELQKYDMELQRQNKSYKMLYKILNSV